MFSESWRVDTQDNTRLSDKMISVMRLILAVSALVIIYFYPSEPDRYAALVYTLLSLYSFYSAAICLAVVRQSKFLGSIRRWAHWLDVAWFTLLVALSSGTNSFFFFGYFFAVLVASFRCGFKEGFRVTTISIVNFVVLSVYAHPYGVELEFNRFLLRCVSFLIIGYMMAYWGGFELTLRRRLELLRELSRFSNTRFGIDYTLSTLLEKLRDFFDADSCLLIVADKEKSTFTMRRTDCQRTASPVLVEPLAADMASKFLFFRPNCAAVYHSTLRWWERPHRHCFVYDSTLNRITTEDQPASEIAVAMFDSTSYLTVPFNSRLLEERRIFLFARHRFNLSEMLFLFQAMTQLLPVLDNIRLVDRMASEAADVERRRIALDIHDSIIQPYIGLKNGLIALQRKTKTGAGVGTDDIKSLLELTEVGIQDLRQYVSSLRSTGASDEGLVPAVKRFTAKFAEATGITIQVAHDEARLNDRLAAEMFQIITEGLNNIRRHTDATKAAICIECNANHFRLSIENERGKEAPWTSFIPRSIVERAEFLGGNVEVKQNKEGNTVVLVEVPL